MNMGDAEGLISISKWNLNSFTFKYLHIYLMK